MNVTTNLQKCSVNITTNRNRLKAHKDKVYLKDGQRFELEIHNPHNYKVLAKIKMNGNYISQSGIVVRPGERVYLERFIDKDESFIFSTYEVEDTHEIRHAISNNGDISVEFYSEYVAPSWFGGITYTNNSNYTTNWPLNYTHDSNGVYYASNTINTSASGTLSTSVETGRVEKGGTTDQTLHYEKGSYNVWVSETVALKILPLSVKPIETREIRSYCTECGTRVKKSSWKFCPSCGEKL